MTHKDPKVRAAYQAEYQRRPSQVSKRKRTYASLPPEEKARRNSQMRERDARVAGRRRKLLSQFPCFCCKTQDDSVIQWHHVNPEDKLFHVSHHKHPEDRWWNEVLKCIPLCANCHVKIHKNLLCLLPIHL